MTLPDNWTDGGPEFHASDENAVADQVNADTAAIAAILSSNSTTTVVEYTTTQTALTVPAGVMGVWIEQLISPGGGGASGRRGAASTVRCGGGGGASGAMVENYWIPASFLGSTFTLILPGPGAGGAAVTVDDTNGNAGGVPAAASFSSGSFSVSTVAGVAAVGGTNALGTGGIAGQGIRNGANGGSASTTGGIGSIGATTTNGAPSGGGPGGGITSANTANNGTAGGAQALQYGLTTAAGGIVSGASPGAGNALVAGIGGQGAGGGAASITGAAQDGGTATGFGGGGGGGGASLDGNNSGNGGNGGPSYARLRWVFSTPPTIEAPIPNAGQELGYVESTAAATTTNTLSGIGLGAFTIPGLSLTIVGTGRPVVVEFVGNGYNATADTPIAAVLLVNGTPSAWAFGHNHIASGFGIWESLFFRARLVLTAGTAYTFTVGMWVSSGTGHFYADNTSRLPMYLSVVGQ